MVIDFDVTSSRKPKRIEEKEEEEEGDSLYTFTIRFFRLSAPLDSYSIPTSISNDVVILSVLWQVTLLVSL